MKISILILSILLSIQLDGQTKYDKQTQEIVEEGKLLYKAEMTSWLGTDLFLSRYEAKDNIGGYFSYSEESKNKCVFYSRSIDAQIIGTVELDSTFQIDSAKIDLEERAFSKKEKDLYEIRLKAIEEIQSDTLFKTYENTNLNLIPLIRNGKKKVYILTGPKESGVVIFGNDYLITFNKSNKVVSKKALHKNIIPIEYGGGGIWKESATMHNHLPETGEFITATDICTLMLYSKYTGWETHNVVSEKYLNIWDCENNSLNVIPMKTLEKINKAEEKRNKKNK